MNKLEVWLATRPQGVPGLRGFVGEFHRTNSCSLCETVATVGHHPMSPVAKCHFRAMAGLRGGPGLVLQLEELDPPVSWYILAQMLLAVVFVYYLYPSSLFRKQHKAELNPAHSTRKSLQPISSRYAGAKIFEGPWHEVRPLRGHGLQVGGVETCLNNAL